MSGRRNELRCVFSWQSCNSLGRFFGWRRRRFRFQSGVVWFFCYVILAGGWGGQVALEAVKSGFPSGW
jgi:hypothetical protein